MRYQSAKDMRVELQRLKRERDTGVGRRAAEASSGPVAVVQDSSPQPVVQQQVPPSGSTPAVTPATAKVAAIPAASGKRLRKILVSSAVAIIVALIVGGLDFHSRPTTALTEKDTVVLADFSNTTGDPVFDDALKQALTVDLEQSPFLNVLSDRRMAETLRLMGREPNDRATREVAQEICLRTGSKAVLAGSISRLGTQYMVGLGAVNCGNGDTLAKEQTEASSKEDVVKALGTVTSRVRTKLGESLASVQKFTVPIEATTSSLEALETFSMGVMTQRQKGDAEAIPFLKRAIELDPHFAIAYAVLGVAYANLSQPSLSAENLKKAYELRDRVSEKERLRISADYYALVTGELEKEAQTYQLWIQSYPRDSIPHGNLGYDFNCLGQYGKSVTETQEAQRLDPNKPFSHLTVLMTPEP